MKLVILKTDIKTKKKVKSLTGLFKNHSDIINWSIDLEDVDNVLRIEAEEPLNENDVIDLINTNGFQCEALLD